MGITMGSEPKSREVREQLLRGEQIALDPRLSEDERSVEPEWILAAVRAGQSVDLSGAIIPSTLDLAGLPVQGLRLVHCHFLATLDARYCSIERSFDISGTLFDGSVDLHGARLGCDLVMRGCTFRGAVDLTEASVRLSCIADQSRFSLPLRAAALSCGSSLIISGATFEEDVFVSDARVVRALDARATVFVGSLFSLHSVLGTVVLRDAVINGVCDFRGSAIDGDIDANCGSFGGLFDFSSCTVGGKALFSACKFSAPAGFRASKFGEVLLFEDSLFASDVDLQAISATAGLFYRVAFAKSARFQGAKVAAQLHLDRAVVGGSLYFDGAELADSLTLTGATIGAELRLSGVECRGQLSLSRIDVQGSCFLDALVVHGGLMAADSRFGGDFRLVSAAVKLEARLRSASFGGGAYFVNTAFLGSLDCREARFDAIAVFDRCRVDDKALLDKAVFRGEASLSGMRCGGQVTMTNCTFDGPARCESIKVSRLAQLDGTTFRKDAHFDGAAFGGPLSLRDVRFIGDADFHGATVLESLNCEGCCFGGRARFESAMVGKKASFDRVVFRSDASFLDAALKEAGSFLKCQFVGSATFDRLAAGSVFFSEAVFVQEVTFGGARITGQAVFEGTEFAQVARFDGAQINDLILAQARAAKGISLVRAEIAGTLDVGGIMSRIGDQGLDLRAAQLGVLLLEHTLTLGVAGLKRKGTTDLRETTYQTLSAAVLPTLSSQMPFDIQPYAAAEAFLRRSGRDDWADEVYYRRRVREGDLKPLWDPRRWGDRFLRWTTGYGVRNWRTLLTVSAVPLAMTLFFTLVPFSSERSEPGKAAVQVQHLGVQDAFRLALASYIPGEADLGGPYKPSECFVFETGIRSASVALIAHLYGLILIPLGIASATGVLRYLGSASDRR